MPGKHGAPGFGARKQPEREMKIKHRLVGGFLVVAVLVGVFGFFSVHMSRKVLQEAIGENMLLSASHTMGDIDRALFYRLEEVQVLASGALLEKELAASNREFDRMAEAGKDAPLVAGVLNNELSEELGERIEFFKRKYGYPAYSGIYVTNKYGAVIAYTGSAGRHLRADGQRRWATAVAQGYQIGDIEYDEETGVFTADLAIKIYDDNGEFAGVLGAAMNMAEVTEILTDLKAKSQYKSMSPVLVSKDGRVMFCGRDPSMRHRGSSVRHEVIGSDLSSREDVSQAVAGKDGYLVVREEGKELLSVFSRSGGYRDFEGLGWSILVLYDLDEIYRPAITLRNIQLVVSGAIIIAAVVIAVLIYRSIYVPVLKLTGAAAALGRGELDTRVDVRSNDEMGMLADSFNRMAQDLKDSRERSIRQEKLSLLGQVASSVGHEIRNPLGVMNNAVFFLKSKLSGADDVTREYLDILKGEIENAESIVADLLNYARTRTPKTAKAGVEDLVAKSLERTRLPDSVRVETDLPGGLPMLRVDPLQIRRVFQNIIKNAGEAMGDGGGSLRITAREDREAGTVSIDFADTGPGIPEEVMANIFQPLFTTKARGIGLGLPIVKSVTEANGGRVDIATRRGEGTTITVTLPAAR